jgi:hypothetical protein
MEVRGQLHHPASFILGEAASGTHCIGGWVGPRAGLDVMEKSLLSLPGIETRHPCHPVLNPVTIPTELFWPLLSYNLSKDSQEMHEISQYSPAEIRSCTSLENLHHRHLSL